MTTVPFSEALRAEYEQLFRTCSVRAEREPIVKALADRIVAQRSRYTAVAAPLAIPWPVVGVIHCMEASLRFDCHLHNGDSLKLRTIHVPQGRPLEGEPPFSWEASARDALTFEALDRWSDWSVGGTLYRVEKYNGFGYRVYHPSVKSPYLWSFSTHYESGKYVADGSWSPGAVSQQCGAAVLLHELTQRGEIALHPAGAPLAPAVAPPPARPASAPEPLISFKPNGPESESARKLQALLNDVLGTQLALDGKPGRLTSDAVRRLLGHRLHGDPED